MQRQRIAILGASGYTGAELVRLLHLHPHADIVALTGESHAGKAMREVYPHLSTLNLPKLVKIEDVDYAGIDVVFCCLPHATTQTVIARIPNHVKVIDLSADFRLSDVDAYARWYGHPHQAPELQKQAVYGLCEINRSRIANACLIANPGCYPTSAQLPLIPLLAAGFIEPASIIIDAKSGVTGAGRAAKQANLFAEVDGGINAYGIGSHRHMPEIEQGLSEAAGKQVTVSFTPHLIPMNRGILSTIYVRRKAGVTQADLAQALHRAYDAEPFVTLLEHVAPSTHMVRGTNHCFIGLFADRVEGGAILVSAIDNLVKGASGQAVQNLNILCGYPETLALEQTALFP